MWVASDIEDVHELTTNKETGMLELNSVNNQSEQENTGGCRKEWSLPTTWF